VVQTTAFMCRTYTAQWKNEHLSIVCNMQQSSL